MGVLSRIRAALAAQLGAALDAATDPRQQIDLLLVELGDHMKAATAELVAYKATEKRLGARAQALADDEARWQARAEAAVLAGDDELAKAALAERRRLADERAACQRERAEMATYAHELLRARKDLDGRIKVLELKKGTSAGQLAVARAGGSSGPLAAEGGAWDALARAEAQIADADALAEVEAALAPGAEADAATEQRFRERMKDAEADRALQALKAKLGKT